MTGSGPAGATLVTTGVVVLVGLVLMALGVWGWRNAPLLSPAVLDEHERYLRARMLRRGSVACAGAGSVLILAVTVGVLRP